MHRLSGRTSQTVNTEKKDQYMPIKKPLTLTKAKDKAWEAFSRYIRLRDCLRTTGTTTHGRCISCQRVYEFKKLQGGHFIPGRKGSNLFDELGVHAQCYQCNIEKKGNWDAYYEAMRDLYGQETIDELLRRNHEIKKYTVSELLEKEKTYKEKYDQKID